MPAFALTALKYWKLIGIGLLVLLLGVQTMRLGHRSNQLEREKIGLAKCQEARKQDRQAYADAQRKAHELNEAEVKRIEQEQQRISSDVESNLNARLERLRSELRKGTPAPQGSPGRPQAGPDGKAPGGVAGKAGVCLAPEELLSAAESEERHDQLITWVEKQLAVPR